MHRAGSEVNRQNGRGSSSAAISAVIASSASKKGRAILQRLKKFLPILTWLPKYNLETGRWDLIAGLTVALTLIPQALAYASLANLPPVYGLYTGLVPQVLYAFFGTAREAAIGPVAVVYLLVGAASAGLPPAEQIQAGVMLAFISGILNTAMGFLKLGPIVDFLSHSVITGFIMGAAVTILSTQVKTAFGMKIPSDAASSVLGILGHWASHLGEIQWVTFGFFAVSMAFLFLCKKFSTKTRKIPGPLLAVAAGTLLQHTFQLPVAIVGLVPQGLPGFAPPFWKWNVIMHVLPAAVSVALLGYLESISVAKSFARKNGYKVDPSQELIAIGLANTIGSFFKAAPCSVSLTRTAVNAEAGAKTQMTKFVSGSVVLCTLLFAAPAFYHLPNAVLASIICMAAFSMFDIPEVKYMWHVKREDFWLCAFTTLVVILFGVEAGMAVSVAASLLWMSWRTFRPRVTVRQMRSTNVPHDHQQEVPVIRLSDRFNFLNCNFLSEKVLEVAEERGAECRYIVLDAGGMVDTDSSACHSMKELVEELKGNGVRLVLADTPENVRTIWDRADVTTAIGETYLFPTVGSAVDFASGAVKTPPYSTNDNLPSSVISLSSSSS